MENTWGAASHTGGRRSVNEDAVLARAPLFVVADGMGGHERGDMASQAVVAEFDRLGTELARDDRHAGPQDVQDAIDRARGTICGAMAEETGDGVAGSTVAGLVLTREGEERYWLAFNVGDSRIYRFVDEELEQVSVDHSLVQELVEAGTITPDEAREHPQRNIITRAVGTGPPPEVDFWMLRADGQEQLVVCSDGLAGELSDEEMRDVLRTAEHPQEAVHALLAAALGGGGAMDNVTVVVVDSGERHENDEESHGTTLPRRVGAVR